MRILFLSDSNGYERRDPLADLVDVYGTEMRIMKALESSQIGVGRTGGSWKEIMKDGKIKHTHVKEGRLSDFKEDDYDIEYRLISGNY